MPSGPKHDENAESAPQRAKGAGANSGLPPELMRFAAMGLEFIGAIAGGLLLGWLVDTWTGATPLWTIVGVVVGLVAGTYAFFRDAVRAGRLARKNYDAKHPRSAERK